jgi:rare lipoprotein A
MLKQRTLICGLVIVFFVLLNGCAHTKRHDGPPNYYVDESKIPNAVPKVEPLSKLGNMPFYTVFGHRYYVMSNSKNYSERGVASWYGTQFHTHRTSSGERYNMLAMTAAHKSLPLPTYVRVTNLRNHKEVIVKVNDRGPFESGRLIDLSYVAAKKLGMLGHGTAMVEVKAINPQEALHHPELMVKVKHHKVYARPTPQHTRHIRNTTDFT